MRALIVFESSTPATEQAAHLVAQGMAAHVSTEVVEVDRLRGRMYGDVDLLVLGAAASPSGLTRHWMRQRRPEAVARTIGLREWLRLLPWASGPRHSAVFDVGGAPQPRTAPGATGRTGRTERTGRTGDRSAATEAHRLLARRRYRALTAPRGFRAVPGSAGLSRAEAKRVRAWGRDLARAAVVATSVPAQQGPARSRPSGFPAAAVPTGPWSAGTSTPPFVPRQRRGGSAGA